MQHPMMLHTTGEGQSRKFHVSIGNDMMTLDGKGVDDLIELLAYFRSSMLPRVPAELNLGDRYHITVDPCWYVELNPLMKATIVFLRHVGLGWTGFALPEPDFNHWLSQLRVAVEEIEEGAMKEARKW